MASFLLEIYTPGSAASGLDRLTAQARAAAEHAAQAGLEVRHVRSFVTPGDQVCFHVFEAPSAETLTRMSELANFDHERITEVIE